MTDLSVTPPVPAGADLAFRLVMTRISKTVDELYRTADRLCCHSPEIAVHVRQLANTVAGEALECLRRWPEQEQ